MENVQGMVSEDAKDILRQHKRNCGFSQQGQALEDILLRFGSLIESQKIEFMKIGAAVMIEALVAERLVPDKLIALKMDIAEEAVRLHMDLMSDTKVISKIIEGASEDTTYTS